MAVDDERTQHDLMHGTPHDGCSYCMVETASQAIGAMFPAPDPELAAMARTLGALEGLAPEQQFRAWLYVGHRLGLVPSPQIQVPGNTTPTAVDMARWASGQDTGPPDQPQAPFPFPMAGPIPEGLARLFFPGRVVGFVTPPEDEEEGGSSRD